MPNIGPLELVIVLVIVLVIFGPKRLPGLGRSLGSGMREFKESITGKGGGDDDHDEHDSIAAAPQDVPQAREDAAERDEQPVSGPRRG